MSNNVVMEIFELYCVQEEGNNHAKLFLKEDPKWQQMSTSPGVSRFTSAIILG